MTNCCRVKQAHFSLQDEAVCQYQPSCIGATMTRYVDVLPTEHFLATAVANVGPISVAIDASHVSFQVGQQMTSHDAHACAC